MTMPRRRWLAAGALLIGVVIAAGTFAWAQTQRYANAPGRFK